MPRLPIGDIGPCEITWDYGGSNEITLSPFLGTVTMKMTDSIKEVQEEAFGEAAVDAIFTGATMELDVPMTRSTLEQLEKVLHGELTGNVLEIHGFVGCSMYEDSVPMLIKPVCDNVPSVLQTEWILIYRTYPFRKFELSWDRSTQRVHLVGFKIFVSQDSGTYGNFYQYGVL